MFVFCPECGAALSAAELDTVSHECQFDKLLEFQTQCARAEIEAGLETQVAAWGRDPRIASRTAFARYLREHSEIAPTPFRRPPLRARQAAASSLFRSIG